MRSIGVLFVFFTLTFSAATRAQGLPESRVNQGLPEFHVNQRLPESARAERTDVQGAIVASLTPSGVSTVSRVSSSVCSIGSQA